MDTRSYPVPNAGGLPLRELPRLAEIARVAIAKGWGHYAERLGLAGDISAAGGRGALPRRATRRVCARRSRSWGRRS